MDRTTRARPTRSSMLIWLATNLSVWIDSSTLIVRRVWTLVVFHLTASHAMPFRSPPSPAGSLRTQLNLGYAPAAGRAPRISGRIKDSTTAMQTRCYSHLSGTLQQSCLPDISVGLVLLGTSVIEELMCEVRRELLIK